ncbi:tripartite tricarboxylate transporter TctB family protein [Metabacillus idriensis]|uniref:tripartite tricarboxylate transporter TctB family protein n=1 Tax=Metabacillus idriensis TaxID=324768 RepID=UPI00174878C4|nr:tripartite tricarboxylate transporter TctB family protein [Metabacillus idriensis]
MSIKFDRAAAILFLTVGALFMYGSMQIAETSYGSVVGPNIFPFFLGAVLFLLSLRLFYETFHYQKKYGEKEPLQVKVFVIIFLSALLYIAALETIGYVITTFVFLLVCFQAMERGNWLKSIMISACFSGGIYYLFVVVLKGTLPSFPVWF